MILTDLHLSSDHAGNYTAGWMISVLLHGGLVIGAFFFVQRIQLAPHSKPFTWNVAMVSSVPQPAPSVASSSSASNPHPSPAKPTTPPATARMQPALPVTEPTKSEPLRPMPPVMTATALPTPPPPHAELQPIKPVPQIMVPTPQPVMKPVDPVPPAPVPMSVAPPVPVEPVKQTAVPIESVNPSHQAPYGETPPSRTERELEPSVVVAPTYPQPPNPMPPVVSTSTEPSPAVTPHVAAPPVETPGQAASSAPQVAALAPPMSNRPARADYGWLSEAILRRVEELKRYPAEARVNRAEGKVVVKAVINEDGSVDDVEIFQSSGYTTLDKAAADLMRHAAPFRLPHPLGKPRVTIKIPMSYRLDR